jgi:predicted metal-binding membrane protein
MGASHAAFCVGCCWALFAVLVAVGTMNLAWMAGLTALIVVEKNAPYGEIVARVAAVALAVLGSVLVVEPSLLTHIT